MEDIATVVHRFILREFLPGEDPGELTPPADHRRHPRLHSTLKLVVFLEEHFGINIEAYEAGVEHLDSVGQIAGLVAAKKQAA